MKSIEIQLNEAIEANEEFRFLDDYCLYTLGTIAGMPVIDYALDLYNHYQIKQEPYYAKFNALRDVVYHIEKQIE